VSTPTGLSLAEMRKRGYLCAVTEKWNPHVGIRQDLFGFGDVLCVGDREVIIVQTTSDSNVAARIRKITEHANTGAVRKGGIRILVHGWKKVGARWALREVDVS
jgi:hypothetical protein